MGKITFIIGGARSGKSSLALKIAERSRRRVTFIATCTAGDREMACRIKRHKSQRPKNWATVEEPRELARAVNSCAKKTGFLIIDCLTLWVTNLMLSGSKPRQIEEELGKALKALKSSKACAAIVSNEVGLGIVPQNKLAREFRDVAGTINRIAAAASDEVFFLVSGLPWRIK